MKTDTPEAEIKTPAEDLKPARNGSEEETERQGKGLRQKIGFFLGPAVFLLMLYLPEPATLQPEGWRVAALGLFMAIWWISEAIPIPATALLPIVLLPVMDVGTIREATAPFANPLIYLFLGGFIIALAMEKSNLHLRIALNIVRFVGVKPGSIVIGFMIAAAFLSMWVSNTATAMMMLPIALSIIALVETKKDMQKGDLQTNFALVLVLSIAYACNLGGVATIIGTPPNALMAGYMLETYGLQIGFAQWMSFGVPLVLVGMPIIYFVLAKVIFRIKLKELPGGKEIINSRLKSIGRMGRAERLVATVFVSVACLWIFQPLLAPFIPGLSDTGIAVFGALLMFMLPVNFRESEFVLGWSEAKRLPWGVLLLFGGGLSLAAAITATGLAEWIGNSVAAFSALPLIVMILIVLLLIIFLTEITSNTATAAAFLPILASVAIAMDQNPLVLVLPATIGVSCAFMLPVATPPNAIVYGSGLVSIPQMSKAGFWLNIIFVVLITMFAYNLMGMAFGVELDVLPDWLWN